MNWGKLLIPPITYSGLPEESWAKIFGRVNKYVEKSTEEECNGGITYEDMVKEALEREAKT